MSDLLFKCPECDNNLCVDEKAIGIKTNCTECNAKIKIPESQFSFNCQKCGEKLLVSKNAILCHFFCPACNQKIATPHKAPEVITESKNTVQTGQTIQAVQQAKGLVRREMGADGVIPMANLANGDEEVKKANQRLLKSIEAMNAKQQKESLKPLFIVLKVIAGLLILWGVQALCVRIFHNAWLGNGMFIVFLCIFVPMYYRAKFLLGVTD